MSWFHGLFAGNTEQPPIRVALEGPVADGPPLDPGARLPLGGDHAEGFRPERRHDLDPGRGKNLLDRLARLIPEQLDAAQAATFTQSFSTCLFALRQRARVQPGESVLVLGAGGGIGLAAIAVARALGCRVIGAASSEDKRRAARASGAEAVIDTTTESIKEAARAWAGGYGSTLGVRSRSAVTC